MTDRCAEVVPLLGPFFDGALAGDDRQWVEEHVRGCACCRDRLALISAQSAALRESLRARAAAPSFDGFADQVMARVRREPKAPAPGQARVWGLEMWGAHRAALTGAAGLALAACMVLAVFLSPPKAAPTDAQLLADATLAQVEQVDFGTHDGAILQLPRNTTVIWMSDDQPVPQ